MDRGNAVQATGRHAEAGADRREVVRLDPGAGGPALSQLKAHEAKIQEGARVLYLKGVQPYRETR